MPCDTADEPFACVEYCWMVTISPATSLWMSMTIGTMKSCTSLRNKVAPSTEPRWKYHSTPRSYCHALNGFRLKLPQLPNHTGSAPNYARSNTKGSELNVSDRAPARTRSEENTYELQPLM